MKMTEVKSVYFIGIGGIGMSAIARYFNNRGANVFGYDKTESPLTRQLVAEGINISYKEDINQIPKQVDLVVYTPAIPSEHTELQFYLKGEFLVLKRAEVLGRIVNEGDCFAVAGSHGKSTTSAMLAHVFQSAGKNSTAFLGAITANYQSNYIAGDANSFVVEADEYDRSFHQIKPLSTIITSIDSDHLDIYGSLEGVREGFQTYLTNIREGGTIFIHHSQNCPDYPSYAQKFTYGLNEGDYYAENIKKLNGAYEFDVIGENLCVTGVQLKMGGFYNIENAIAVIAMASHYGISSENIVEAFRTFKGLYRRFETVYSDETVVLIDDYAHHPNEIRAFINGVKEFYPNKSIGAIFQPHLYSRTKDYAEHFAESLDLVDKAYLLEIYPARELPIEGVNSGLILDSMKNKSEVISKEEIIEKIENINTDIIVTIGAGDISRLVDLIKKNLQKNK